MKTFKHIPFQEKFKNVETNYTGALRNENLQVRVNKINPSSLGGFNVLR